MPGAGLILLVLAIVLMLGSAALVLADVIGPALAIPLITVGIALSVIAQTRRRDEHIPSH